MSELSDVEAAVKVLVDFGVKKELITILHCNTEYPTPYEDVNLKAMLEIGSKFGVSVGYSDHTKGIEVPIAAVALGATVIEKHFTLDRNMEGPDHKASLEPDELKAMVVAIRNIELALGSGHKCVSESERKNIEIARKSIVAACPIKRGDVFTEDNLTVKRPGNGISPMRWNEVIGRTAIKDFEEEEMITL
jgi:N,N'-diacetyllegionaminate synthase